MDKILGDRNDEKVGVAGDQTEYQQQQSSTLADEDAPTAEHKKSVFGFRDGEGGSSSSPESETEEGKERQRCRHEAGVEHRQQGGETDTSRSIPPFTEGYGTTGSHEGVEGEKHHGFANAV